VCEEYGVSVTFDPKPVADADGCALHTNVSTAASRAPGGAGWAALQRYMALLGATHKDHLAVYGPGLERRLIGREEYSSMVRGREWRRARAESAAPWCSRAL
jgi:glutamine synthetase